MQSRVVVIAFHVRSGITALNVVTAALDVDARTAGTDVVFATDVGAVVTAARAARAEGRAALVAFSFYSLDAPWALEQLAVLRGTLAGAGVRFVVGGVHASTETDSMLHAGFDWVVRGEGEATFIECVAALAEGASERDLPGTSRLAASGRVDFGASPRRPLDDFPPLNLRYGKWNPIEITRGCIYACSFCATPFAFKARFRHRSVENVRHFVRETVAQGAHYCRFISPTALSYGTDGETPDLIQVEALLHAVRAELPPGGKLYFGTFPSEVRPEHVTPEALAILRRYVDNQSLVIGGQSGSDRVLDRTHRGHRAADVERAVDVAIAAGFRPDVDFLFGTPGEDLDDRRASLALAERLVERGARVHNHAFLPLPGTPLGKTEPEPLEPEVIDAMHRLQARGALYGQWRRQLTDARALVAARSLVRRRS